MTKAKVLPLIKNFKATNFNRAFILNAFCIGLISTLTIQVRSYLDSLGRKTNDGWKVSNIEKTFIVFVAGFLVALLVYYMMWLLVEFGGGMLA